MVEKGRRRYGPGRIEEISYRADEVRYPEISAKLLALLSELKCRKCNQPQERVKFETGVNRIRNLQYAHD